MRISVPPRTGARGARPAHRRAGFTVTEMLIASLLMVIVVGAALPFVLGQPRVIAAAAARGEAGQNARFALNMVEREVRMIGVNTLASQPMLVYADPYAITFNADLVTNVKDDIWSVSYDSTMTDDESLAMQPPGIAPPRGGNAFVYPTAPMLMRDGALGSAETVSYWVSPDSSTTRPNEYVLFRRVNRAAPAVVSTGIYIPKDSAFFVYRYVKDSTGVIARVPDASLPLRHTAAQHGIAADTGENARIASRIDRVRTVEIRAMGQFQDVRRGGGTGRRTATASATLINVVALRRNSCGTAPDPTNVTATLVKVGGQPSYVHLTWPAASDDGAGERDIDRYLIYRTENSTTLTDPIADVPAMNKAGTTYTYDDYDVKRPAPGIAGYNAFAYAVAAQDCQPQVATTSLTAAIAVPVVP